MVAGIAPGPFLAVRAMLWSSVINIREILLGWLKTGVIFLIHLFGRNTTVALGNGAEFRCPPNLSRPRMNVTWPLVA